MTTVKRNSRQAVHYIAQAPHYGYECGVTEHQVHSRSGGATSNRSQVTCEDCRARLAWRGAVVMSKTFKVGDHVRLRRLLAGFHFAQIFQIEQINHKPHLQGLPELVTYSLVAVETAGAVSQRTECSVYYSDLEAM